MSSRAFPNLGADDPEPKSRATRLALEPVAGLFRNLIEAEVPPFAFLGAEPRLWAWFNDAAAVAHAGSLGLELGGADSESVRRCHDKAFSQWASEWLGLTPAPLRGWTRALGAHECDSRTEVGELVQWLVGALDSGPSPEGFTVKPRFGTSGRGRIALRSAADLARLEAATSRFARAGGLLVEPWSSRLCDLSVVMFVEPNGEITIVGSAEQDLTPSGGYRGHRGRVDARGRMTSDSPFDEPLREAGVEIARLAAEQGYHGPCGVDGYVFEHGGRRVLRPVVEFNARFTIGWLVAASLRSRLRELRDRFGLRPDHPLGFEFVLCEPEFMSDTGTRGAVFGPLSQVGESSALAGSDADLHESDHRRETDGMQGSESGRLPYLRIFEPGTCESPGGCL